MAPNTSEVVVDGLNFPGGLNVGPDGALYISDPPNGANHGEGWPARVNMAGEVEGSPTANCPSMATPAA